MNAHARARATRRGVVTARTAEARLRLVHQCILDAQRRSGPVRVCVCGRDPARAGTASGTRPPTRGPPALLLLLLLRGPRQADRSWVLLVRGPHDASLRPGAHAS